MLTETDSLPRRIRGDDSDRRIPHGAASDEQPSVEIRRDPLADYQRRINLLGLQDRSPLSRATDTLLSQVASNLRLTGHATSEVPTQIFSADPKPTRRRTAAVKSHLPALRERMGEAVTRLLGGYIGKRRSLAPAGAR